VAFPQATIEGLFMAKKLNTKNSKSENGNGRTQTFSFTAPTATSVQLVGDFTHWQQRPINLQKGADGTWHTTVELGAGPHRYRFLVDGQWRDDPDCTLREPNPFGGQDSVRQVA
jgi:1,4-alpha-glucan branching enzyme